MTSSNTLPSIYIIGAQNTGKTTLIRALQQHFNSQLSASTPPPEVITEVARGVLVKHNFTAHDIVSSPARALALQQLILEAQVSAERTALSRGTWFISDRSGIDPIVYSRKYVSEAAAMELLVSPQWLELRARMSSSIVFVCEAGAEWLMDDGVRLMPGSRQLWLEFQQFFRTSLDTWGVSYEVIGREMIDINARVALVVSKWQMLQMKLPESSHHTRHDT